MGISGSKQFDRNKEELIKQLELAGHRVRLLRKRQENELAQTYQAMSSNGPDVLIKGEQCIYQESCLQVTDHLIKDLNLLKARKHLFGPELDDQLTPCIATVIHCSQRLDVPELRQATNLLRRMYDKNLNPTPNQELLDKLNPRAPTEEEVNENVDRVLKLFRSKSGLKPASERHASNCSKPRTELDDLLERIQALRS